MLGIFTALQDVKDEPVKVDLGAAEKEGIIKEAARAPCLGRARACPGRGDSVHC